VLGSTTPSFGDGLTDPRLTEDEATIAVDRLILRFVMDLLLSSTAPFGAILPTDLAMPRRCFAPGEKPSHRSIAQHHPMTVSR
jgi:hypothetical protein